MMGYHDRPWRNIVRTDKIFEEKVSETSRTYNWNKVEVSTLTLECGHTQVRRGYSCPSTKVVCKDCEAGKRKKKVTVEHGVFDHRHKGIKDPVVQAIINNARGKR
jgi:hypothetical protein